MGEEGRNVSKIGNGFVFIFIFIFLDVIIG